MTMSRREEILGERRDAIRAVAARNAGEAIALVGSVARGEDTDSSDVDFVVWFRPGASLLDHAHLELDLEDLVGCEVDVVSAGSPSRCLANMLEDAISL